VILDALVEQRVLPDDGPKWVVGIGHTRVVDRVNPYIGVTIEEVQQ